MLTISVIALCCSAYFVSHTGPGIWLIHSNLLFFGIGSSFWFRKSPISPVVLDAISIFSNYAAFIWVVAMLGTDSGINITALCSALISLLMFFPKNKYLLAASLACSLLLLFSPLAPFMDHFYPEYRSQLNALPRIRTLFEVATFFVTILTSYFFSVFWASRVLSLKKEKSEKEYYLKILTHDLKHPIVHTLLTIRKLKASDSLSQKDIQALEIAQVTVKEIINNVENINSDGVNLSYHITDFSIQDCMQKILPWLESRLTEKELTIDSSKVDRNHKFKGHFESFAFQVLQNILTNAIKFSNPKSSLQIMTSQNGTKTIWFVSDAGKGISDEELDRNPKPNSGTFGEIGAGLGVKIIKLFSDKSRVQVSWVKKNGTTVCISQDQSAYSSAISEN
jgi:signal transduction histidine kinase